jgi:hypothetical protein
MHGQITPIQDHQTPTVALKVQAHPQFLPMVWPRPELVIPSVVAMQSLPEVQT